MKNIIKILNLCLLIGVSSLLILLSIKQAIAKETKSAEGIQDKPNPVSSVRDSILSFFIPVDGVISGVEEDQVIVTLDSNKRLRKGTRFSVFRKGGLFYHPVTGDPISRTERFIGRVEIKEIDSNKYLCKVIRGSPESGDIVRITSSPIKLAFFQDRGANWELSELFYNSLKSSGRFELIETYTRHYSPEELSRLAREQEAEVVLFLSTPVKGGKMFLNARLFWSEDATAFAEINEVVSSGLVREVTSAEEFVSIHSVEEVPWEYYELKSGRLIAMGDIDGNGEDELVVSDGNNIHIYTYKREPREIWSLKGDPVEEHLSIDVLDVNNNGREEIFVTSLRNRDTMSSFVFEYVPTEGYRKILDKSPYFFRVIGRSLLMQSFSPFRFFTGPVYKGIWKDGTYKKDRPIGLPEGIDIYGFTYVDWQSNGKPSLIAFDDRGYLNLYNDNKLIWKSKESYGTFDITFKKKGYSVANPVERWFVKGRLITINTEKGQEVIVIKKLPFLSNVPGLGYKKAEVYSLWWDGQMMNEELVLRGIKGSVTDYYVKGDNLLIIAQSNLLGFLKNALSGNLNRGSILYYYSMGGK
jgi:hypothetical protein